ncbi:hypothetical protein KUV62_07005 [Salipiger bermudensis]|uniref:hypothetical protein n=1 Tax=Salipiger bermudensis TaxID=344736 RepID=UPI001C9A2B2D|nr:hypothetical protein [Salipiger bermudensis]MBY6003649.1 hypothetical protein [Salipiger bermudensis]
MQMTGVPSLVAPLATGHPLGLPAQPAGPAAETRVQPVAQQAQTGTDPDPGGQPPSNFWRGLTGLPDPKKHVAPPSIMQIKIAALLEEQAQKMVPSEPVPDGDSAAPGYGSADPGARSGVFPSAA